MMYNKPYILVPRKNKGQYNNLYALGLRETCYCRIMSIGLFTDNLYEVPEKSFIDVLEWEIKLREDGIVK